jgi:hypothetical protein
MSGGCLAFSIILTTVSNIFFYTQGTKLLVFSFKKTLHNNFNSFYLILLKYYFFTFTLIKSKKKKIE